MRRPLVAYVEWLQGLPDPRRHVTFAVGRSAVALGVLLTLLFTPREILFYRSPNYPQGVVCGDTLTSNTILLPCITGTGPNTSTLLITAVVLIAVIVGWRPRIMALPFWYVVASFVLTTPIPDGGDHLALVLATLIAPASIADGRRWIWNLDHPTPGAVGAIVARSVYMALSIQLAFVYLHASLGKLIVPEWRDGTAIWYWSRQSYFGFPDWLRPATDSILSGGAAVTLGTYLPIVIEMLAVIAVIRFGRHRFRTATLLVVVGFHAAIAVAMGLISFFLSAFALLLVVFGFDLERVVGQSVGGGDDRRLDARAPAQRYESRQNRTPAVADTTG